MQKFLQIPHLLPLLIIPPAIYLLSYLPFFLQGHGWDQFVELQRQMYYYHTHLKAHHDYSSPAWSWPLNLYPVWYYVQYGTNTIANIFTSGNPILFWGGLGSLLLAFWQLFKFRSKPLLITLLGYFLFWFPWLFSPRIMFLYHYSPSVPFLSLIFGYELSEIWREKRARWQVILILALVVLGFIAVYPFLTGIPLPKEWVSIFFRFNLAKNPFIR